MPNVNRPQGLIPVGRSTTGGNLELRAFTKVVGYATRVRVGDVVAQVASGDIERTITPGTTRISGVALAYSPASTADTIPCIVDPFALFVAQAGGSTGLAAADRGLNANITLGTTSTFYSDDIVNDATEDVTATLDLRIIDKVDQPDNDWGQYVKVLVQINKHRGNNETAGV
jgi:hypothetical protein